MASPKWSELRARVSEALMTLRARYERYAGAVDALEQKPESRTAQHEVGRAEHATQLALQNGVLLALEGVVVLLSEQTACAHKDTRRFVSRLEARSQRYSSFKLGLGWMFGRSADERANASLHLLARDHARVDEYAGDIDWCVDCGAVRAGAGHERSWFVPGSPEAELVENLTTPRRDPDEPTTEGP